MPGACRRQLAVFQRSGLAGNASVHSVALAGAYRDAYVSLSAPALFAPFVRLELLKWRPLHGGEAGGRRINARHTRTGSWVRVPCNSLRDVLGQSAPWVAHATWPHPGPTNPAGFDGHQWYQQLFDYGMLQDPAALDPNDPDANLVPQLVLVRWLAGVWQAAAVGRRPVARVSPSWLCATWPVPLRHLTPQPGAHALGPPAPTRLVPATAEAGAAAGAPAATRRVVALQPAAEPGGSRHAGRPAGLCAARGGGVAGGREGGPSLFKHASARLGSVLCAATCPAQTAALNVASACLRGSPPELPSNTIASARCAHRRW